LLVSEYIGSRILVAFYGVGIGLLWHIEFGWSPVFPQRNRPKPSGGISKLYGQLLFGWSSSIAGSCFWLELL
jgi:hypothetical protein